MKSSLVTETQQERKVQFSGIHWNEEEERSTLGSQRRKEAKMRKAARKEQERALHQPRSDPIFGADLVRIQNSNKVQPCRDFLVYATMTFPGNAKQLFQLDEWGHFSVTMSNTTPTFAKLENRQKVKVLLEDWGSLRDDTLKVSLLDLWRSAAILSELYIVDNTRYLSMATSTDSINSDDSSLLLGLVIPEGKPPKTPAKTDARIRSADYVSSDDDSTSSEIAAIVVDEMPSEVEMAFKAMLVLVGDVLKLKKMHHNILKAKDSGKLEDASKCVKTIKDLVCQLVIPPEKRVHWQVFIFWLISEQYKVKQVIFNLEKVLADYGPLKGLTA